MKNHAILISAALAALLCILAGCSSNTSSQNNGTQSSHSTSASSQSQSTSQPSLSSTQAKSDIQTNAIENVGNHYHAANPPLKVDGLHALPNNYHVPERYFKYQQGVNYGTIEEDVQYYSTTAGDNKYCNVLLPAHYDPNQTYPVMYVIHGWGGKHGDIINNDAYLPILYGNMLAEDLAVPQIIVDVDMYTDKLADKDKKSDEEMRHIYDKVVDDIGKDVIPFIESRYPVKKEREFRAIAGMSQGGSESLCTGFQWLDKFAYIAGFAPDTGVIPTKWYQGTFWNYPYFQEFPQPTDQTMPRYLYMPVGSNDPWNIDCTLYYSDVLNKMGVQNKTDLVEGYEHTDEFWQQCFYNYLEKIFK